MQRNASGSLLPTTIGFDPIDSTKGDRSLHTMNRTIANTVRKRRSPGFGDDREQNDGQQTQQNAAQN